MLRHRYRISLLHFIWDDVKQTVDIATEDVLEACSGLSAGNRMCDNYRHKRIFRIQT